MDDQVPSEGREVGKADEQLRSHQETLKLGEDSHGKGAGKGQGKDLKAYIRI